MTTLKGEVSLLPYLPYFLPSVLLSILCILFLAAMLGRLRRLCQPALASQTTRPLLAAVTSTRALHTTACVETDEHLQDCEYYLHATKGHANTINKATDPHIYTTGRWLNRDKLQCEARYVKFDFAALCKKAVHTCSGATKVIRYEKKEGGFNRVFILYLDNGERVVARVPFPIAGPRRLVTNSEVATMTYGMIGSVRNIGNSWANGLSSKVVYKDTRPQSS